MPKMVGNIIPILRKTDKLVGLEGDQHYVSKHCWRLDIDIGFEM